MLSFDRNVEIEQRCKEDARQGGWYSKALAKHMDFPVVWTVPKSGACLHEHKATGRISVQTVVGHIRMHVDSKILDLPAGHRQALERAIAHDEEALKGSAFLLTTAWPENAKKS